MIRPILATLAIALLAASASAQKMGSSNRGAPRVDQSIELGTAAIDVNYTAITFGGGGWAKTLENEASRNRMRDRINQTAESAPLGEFECTHDVTVAGQKVEEGAYKMCFKLDDTFKWQILLFNDDARVTIPLELIETEQPSKRLVVALHAGDEDGTAGLYIAFGDLMGTLTIVPAEDDGDDDD